ncbi:MAG: ribosome-associated translation inhibitor RaiA [Chitinophagaceae bacterium]|nr:ribosome-associated translation inhibitor RaiA [Anaerolineae bacterium]
MDVLIRGHNVKINDSLEEFARSKLGRLDRYLPHILEVRVDLSCQHNSRGEDLNIAQITLKHERGAILRAEEKVEGEKRDSLEAAINLAVDKMYRQITRFKGKQRVNRKERGERFIATVEELELAEDIPGDEMSELAAEYGEFADSIIRRKQVEVSLMSEEEAIDQMELLGHSFFMFHNAATGTINVLYRRDSGGYGVLVPQLM